MAAILIPAQYDGLKPASFQGLSRDDPWALRLGAGTVALWKTAGLRVYTTADDFDATDYTANSVNYTAKWNSKLVSDYPYVLREIAGHTGTQALVVPPSGFYGDQNVVQVVDPVTGDAKLEVGAPSAAGYAPILPTSGAFRIDVGVYLAGSSYYHIAGTGSDASKFSCSIVNGEIRLSFATSGTGVRSLNVTPAVNPAAKMLQLAIGRTVDNKAFIRYRYLGDADWTEVQSAPLVSSSSVVYAIPADLVFWNFTPAASYGSAGYWRYFAVWVANPLSTDRDSWERLLTRSNALL